MATENKKGSEVQEISIEEKLKSLYQLQKAYSEIDKIGTLRGELPLEVQDLEDDIAGLETRISNYREETKSLDAAISGKKNEILDAQALIKKYQEQQDNVRNNREYDSISKEMEFQTLEIELCEKRIREFSAQKEERDAAIASAIEVLEERKIDLDNKRRELDEITADTSKEMEVLVVKAEEAEKIIDSRLLAAFKRIRGNVRNGLAVVTVQRDSCGGCFANIPPQRQLDIRSRKKVIVCEYCGRILVDSGLDAEVK
jgi:predicted  nucleic acid-binding Zn-ribbon protein